LTAKDQDSILDPNLTPGANQMATYKVELVLTVNEGHPRKWLADAIYANLQEGEDIEDISFEEMQVVDS
jgi:hypothetical protein